MANTYEWYKQGTIIVRNGDSEVVGANTDWLKNGIKQGDIFIAGEKIYEIAEVIGNTSLTLTKPYTGISDGAAEYSIVQRGAEILQADLALAVQQAIVRFNELDTRTNFLSGVSGLELALDLTGDWTSSDTTIPAATVLTSLPLASKTQAGVVKIGNNVDVQDDGTISVQVDKDLIQESFDQVAAETSDIGEMLDDVWGNS